MLIDTSLQATGIFVEIVGIVKSVALESAERRLDRQLPGSGINRNDAAHQIAGVGVGQVTEAVIWPINLQSRPATAGNAVDNFLENPEAGFGLYYRPGLLNGQRAAEHRLAVIVVDEPTERFPASYLWAALLARVSPCQQALRPRPPSRFCRCTANRAASRCRCACSNPLQNLKKPPLDCLCVN